MFRIVIVLCSMSALSCFSQTVKITLADAIRQADKNNPFLRTEQIRLPIAGTELKKSKLYQNPVFNLQYLQLLPSSSLYSQGLGMLHAYNSQDWFQLTKRFQVFGQRSNKISLAKLSYAITESDIEESRREVLYEVSIKWIEAWKALAARNLAVKAANYLDDFMTQHDSVKAVPVGADEKLRYDILDDQYDLQETMAQQNYASIIQELKILTGALEEIDIDLSDTTEKITIENLSFDSLLAIAQAHRMDIKSLYGSTRYAAKNVQYQQSLAIPQPEAGFVWNPQNTIPYFGLYFTQTLPFFDRNHTEVQKAKLLANSSEIELNASLTKLRIELAVTFSAYKQKKTMVRRFQHNLHDSENLLKLVRDASLKGKNPIVDIWEAEETWFQSFSLYYDAFVDYRKSYVSLLHQLNLLGRLN